jgi:hypothetical protein
VGSNLTAKLTQSNDEVFFIVAENEPAKAIRSEISIRASHLFNGQTASLFLGPGRIPAGCDAACATTAG